MPQVQSAPQRQSVPQMHPVPRLVLQAHAGAGLLPALQPQVPVQPQVQGRAISFGFVMAISWVGAPPDHRSGGPSPAPSTLQTDQDAGPYTPGSANRCL